MTYFPTAQVLDIIIERRGGRQVLLRTPPKFSTKVERLKSGLMCDSITLFELREGKGSKAG